MEYFAAVDVSLKLSSVCVVDGTGRIMVADREHQVPADGPEDHLGSELSSLKDRPGSTAATFRCSAMPRFVPARRSTASSQQNPLNGLAPGV